MLFSTPNGLPGIPVSSGGNYTDEQGQQWVCDEVNLERGVYVQRVKTVNITKVRKGWDSTPHMAIFDTEETQISKNGFCTHFIVLQYISELCCFINDGFDQIIFFNKEWSSYKDAQTFIDAANAANNPVRVTYLINPIETPLSETDIAAYRALTTYGPTTIVETDGAGMKLDYQQDVNIVIKQLTDAIASITN